MPPRDVILTAQWQQDSFTLTYLPGAERVSDMPQGQTNLVAGTSVSAASAPTREGYGFTGWASSEGGTLQVQQTFTMPARDVVLTAQWQEEDTTPSVITPGAGQQVVPEAPNPDEEAFINLFGQDIPLVGKQGAAWSLFDLICTLVALIAVAVMMIRVMLRRRPQKEEETGDSQKEQRHTKVRLPFALISLACALVAVVLFVLTQDLRLPVALFDFWSVFFAALVLICCLGVILTFRREVLEEDEERDYTVYQN
jgi:uncharacterized repeat protein (TIGR02543 family)